MLSPGEECLKYGIMEVGMEMQNYEIKNKTVRNAFINKLKKEPERAEERLKMSWSNWGFGREKLEESVKRLKSTVWSI